MAKVSVVMPAYNVASYIGAAVASVQAQTHRDWSALSACGGGPVVGVASFMARRAPRLLSRAYQLRRACLRTP